MVSDKPKEDRCAAEVTEKVGLEVHADDHEEVFSDDDGLVSVELKRGAVAFEEDPYYPDVVSYLRKGYSLSAVFVESEGDEEREKFPITDDDPYVTNRDTEHQGFCERYQMDNGRCYVHGGANDGPPEGNLNAATHFLHADEDNFYNQKLNDTEKAIVHSLADGWKEKGGFEHDDPEMTEIFRIAVDQVRLWKSHEHFADFDFIDEFVVGYDDDGNPQEVIDENPANLPYSRLDGDNVRKLKEFGCLNDPDSQQAEANITLAEKFAQVDRES